MKRNLKLLVSLISIPFLLCACNEEPTTQSTGTTDTSSDTSGTSDQPAPVPESEVHKISKTINAHFYFETEGPKMNVYNFQGKGDVPYVRFEKLVSTLYRDVLQASDLTFKNEHLGNGVFHFYLKGYEEHESIMIDVVNDTVKIEADNYSLFNSFSTTSTGKRYFVSGQYTDYIKIDNGRSKVYVQASQPTYNLKKYKLDIVCDEDGLVFMPFNVANDIFLLPIGVSLVFNGKEIFFADYVDYYKANYTSTSSYLDRATRSSELAQYTYNEFCFFVENIYGLRERRDFVGKFDKILADSGYKTDLLSTNTATYEAAMANVVAKIFYDGHSGYLNPSLFVNSDADSYKSLYRSVLQNENAREIGLMSVYNDLNTKRNAAHKGIGLEIDGDTAFIRFDGFNMSSRNIQNFDVDEYTYNQLNKDTILLFKKAFLDISRNASIKNVVVDISMNGGGAADTLPWLTAYFTSHPSMTVMHDQTGECFETYYQVDLNFDGTRGGEDDTYEGKYNFYLLTSGYSFSCGNYFPTIIKEKGLMTIIGHKSGGGECSVGSYANGTGSILRNSSTYHLGYYDKDAKKFIGNDGGIEVDYELAYSDYYNNSAIKTLINNIQSE